MTTPITADHERTLGCTCPLCYDAPIDTAADLLPERYEPAGRADCPNILNGIYTFFPDMDGDHSNPVIVRVHTVTTGRLEGMRILQQRPNTVSRWEGFASLQRDGRVYIWQRNAALRGTEQHQFLSLMFRTINNERRLPCGTGAPQTQVAGRRVVLSHRTCNHCNISVNTMSSGCHAHAPLYRESDLVTVDGATIDYSQRQTSGRTVFQPARPQSTATQGVGNRFMDREFGERPGESAAPRRRTFTPIMSEIDSTMIQ